MLNQGLSQPLSPQEYEELRARAAGCRGAVLTATSVAGSGHPGGSFSSMEIYTLLWATARVNPAQPLWDDRDRIVVSHGHTSPGVYSVLAASGFFDTEQFTAHFRQAGSLFEGHVERAVPGVEWSTGNLGQGLSAGVGMAIGARLAGKQWHTVVAMSDGEQHKGQVAEARRLAVNEGLGNVTVVVDWNRVQISGHTDEVMPVPLVADWEADGWKVYECDGHDIEALHAALIDAVDDGVPSVVLAHTLIGKGVSFMEDEPEFHGRGLDAQEYPLAMAELGCDPAALEVARAMREQACTVPVIDHHTSPISIDPGEAHTYPVGTSADNRGAWGRALVDIAQANPDTPIAVFDCDLAVSVKTDGFAAQRPDGFIQCGVGEHNAATASGAASVVPGVLSFWSDFGAFGVDEVYNQQRLNDINTAALKLAVTHCGLDVGEDGKTHQCLDYVGAFRNLFGWKVIVPADPNQTDRAVRAMPGLAGNVAIAMGRSKLPIIEDGKGRPLFACDYQFEYGDVVWARTGSDACILVCGTPSGAAVAAADLLEAQGHHVAVGICAAPLAPDPEQLEHAEAARLIVTVEDHNRDTGLGATVAAWISDTGCGARLVRHGIEAYQSSGAAKDLYARAGLDAAGIAAVVTEALGVSG